LNCDLFDVAMLAGLLAERKPAELERVVPFCPVLSQGWGLLRVRAVRMEPEVVTAGEQLRPALWTTFEPKGMDIVENIFRRLQ